ncbi:MAG: hypothetical protein LBV70_04545, partial [Candidatus Adiutrix sp.]|nr:hypothetical protein [Candidatus Adiutrix sp.]
MRCKCGFNSFDHHLVCPKCHRDLTARRRLLNLDLPAPGTVNFFQLAGQRMAVPQPLLGAAAGSEDFGEDLQPAEDIRPIALGANQPTSAGETASPQPWPGLSAYGAAAGEITPSPPRAFAVPAGEPPAGTEAADDFEVVQPVSWPWPEAAFTPVTPPPPHHA